MGLFGWFGSSEEEKQEQQPLPWKPLRTMEQLDKIEQQSKTRPVVIFKHSTRCGISSMTLRRFEKHYDIPEEAIDLYYLDLLSFRDLSNEVAGRFQVWHQSPQMLIIQNGKAVAHASHHGIQPSMILQFIK